MSEMSIEDVLDMMRKSLGEEPKPMLLMSKLLPFVVLKQAQDRKFTFELPNIPPKYKHLICFAVAPAVSSHLFTETYVKLASRSGISKEEIAEALLVAKLALGSTTFASALEGMEYLTK